jgi:hypothetical protein
MDEYHGYDEKVADENNMDKYPCLCNVFLDVKVRKINLIY